MLLCFNCWSMSWMDLNGYGKSLCCFSPIADIIIFNTSPSMYPYFHGLLEILSLFQVFLILYSYYSTSPKQVLVNTFMHKNIIPAKKQSTTYKIQIAITSSVFMLFMNFSNSEDFPSLNRLIAVFSIFQSLHDRTTIDLGAVVRHPMPWTSSITLLANTIHPCSSCGDWCQYDLG